MLLAGAHESMNGCGIESVVTNVEGTHYAALFYLKSMLLNLKERLRQENKGEER